MVGLKITPDDVSKWPVRMPSFEEFVWLAVRYPQRLHEVINKFVPGTWPSLRFPRDAVSKLWADGFRGEQLAYYAYLEASAEKLVMKTGDIATFAPRTTRDNPLGYFVISHPFEVPTIAGKQQEMQTQSGYIAGGSFMTGLVKTICLKHPSSGYILVSLHGDARVSWGNVASALGFSNAERKKMAQFDGDLEEAIGLPPGKVSPLIPEDKLSNIAAVIIDSSLEAHAASYELLELPLNVVPHRIRELGHLLMSVHDERYGIEISGKRELGLAYKPNGQRLAEALRACYGLDKVLVADVKQSD